MKARFEIVTKSPIPMSEDTVRVAVISLQSYGNWTDVYLNISGDGRAYNRGWQFRKFDSRDYLKLARGKYEQLLASYAAKPNSRRIR